MHEPAEDFVTGLAFASPAPTGFAGRPRRLCIRSAGERMTTAAEQVYVLKVALIGAKRIWRTIAIREDQTLSELHDAIFDAFGRFEEHLYSFYTPKRKTTSIRTICDAPEYTHPMAMEGTIGKRDVEKTSLKDLRFKPKATFYYLFDFGDSWWHEITVDAVEPAQKMNYPAIIATKGESPPQYGCPEDE